MYYVLKVLVVKTNNANCGSGMCNNPLEAESGRRVPIMSDQDQVFLLLQLIHCCFVTRSPDNKALRGVRGFSRYTDTERKRVRRLTSCGGSILRTVS